jgi:aminobenzoyl-glutamate utilization protein B
MDRRNLLALMAGSALTSVMGTQAWAQATGLKAEAFKDVDAHAVLVQQMVDTVFSFGEPGFEEVRTSAYLTGVLEQNGFKVTRGVAGIPTAFIATWGEGGPLIALGSDIDGLRGLSQIPGVPKPTPMVSGAPGHGEGHNAGMPLMIAAAIAAKKVMTDHKIPGRLMLWPGVAEELIGSKAHYVKAGLFKDVDACVFAHVADKFGTAWGDLANNAAVSVEFTFHGLTAHAAGAPWLGKSALDGVEVMDVAWNMRREHLPLSQRSHYVITNGGDQPNIVPDKAAVWYYFRDKDFASVRKLYEIGVEISEAAAKATATTVTRQILGYAAPNVGNKPLAEAMQANIDLVGMPAWSADDQAFATRVQLANGFKPQKLNDKVEPLSTPEKRGPSTGGGSDDIGDIMWATPTITLRFPSNIPGAGAHNVTAAMAMATPIAHKGAVAGAKAVAATVLDLMTQPKLVADAKDWFTTVQLKDQKYDPILAATDKPAIDINAKLMKEMRPQMEPFYFDAKKHKTYLEQLGVKYPG